MSLEDANGKIRNAWITGLIAVAASAILTFEYARNPWGIGKWDWLDILIMLVLTTAVYKKSRVGAVLLLVYYLGSNIVTWVQTGYWYGLPFALIFVYFFYQGVRGALAYHELTAVPASDA
ncbi:MAG TPA: hypothetical protein EYP41_13035 [Anaerolineae bacterium]|nr:hypothetical protein [Anaerolineae bacterium]HIP72356.1 hypothetical protein [Anaerolineae bacterium]